MTNAIHPYYIPTFPKEEEGGVRCMLGEGIYPTEEMVTDTYSEITHFGELWFHKSRVDEYLDLMGLAGEERDELKLHLTSYGGRENASSTRTRMDY